MADNVTTQSAAPATPAASTIIATVEATHSGDTVQAGVSVLAKSAGAEGSRVLTVINPATEDKQDTAITALGALATQTTAAAILAKIIAAPATEAKQDAAAVLTGAVTETAPGTDTASSGLNGRLQRVAQRLTSLIALLPAALGAGGGLKVDGSGTALPVSLSSAPLPTGAATETTLAALNTKVTAVNTGAVVVSSSALPTGAATETTGAATLATLGATSGAKVITDATGTVQQYLRGLIYLFITSGQALVTASLAAGSNLIGSVTAKGGAATNVAVADNPLNNGAQAVSSENAAVTTGRMVQLVADLVGKLIVLPYANPENFVSGAITSAMTGTTSTSLLAAPGAGLRNYVTTLIISNAHATVGTDVVIQDGSGGTTLLTIPAAAVYGGAVINLPVPLRQPTANTALFCANVTTGASVKASAVGYKGA